MSVCFCVSLRSLTHFQLSVGYVYENRVGLEIYMNNQELHRHKTADFVNMP